jgi:hypothetical protein
VAFDRDKLYQQAETAIKENNLFFIEDIIAFIPCSKQTFYDYFPVGSDEMDDLKGLLEKNKIRTKSAIRAKLYKSPKASELLALYRLICTPEERKMLNQNYIELTGKDGKDLLPKIEIEIVNGEG